MRKLKNQDFPKDLLDPSQPTGLILGGMGGPDGPDAIEPFLRNLFQDPAVLPMPAPIARLVGAMIVRKRADEVRRRYESLGYGGASPQLSWAKRQCAELERLLAEQGLEVYAAPAMRYWHPFPDEAVAELRRKGARQFLLVPAYPQYSGATSGSVLSAVCEFIQSAVQGAPVHVVRDWHLLPGYLDALTDRAEPVLRRWAVRDEKIDRCALLPVAHSLPERFIRAGDPYRRQTEASVAGTRQRVTSRLSDHRVWCSALPGLGRPLLAFQSQVGPVRWIGPDVVDETKRLASAGCKRLLILPVSFTCEHIETLHELDVQLAATAEQAGIEEFVRAEALNLDARWLRSLADQLAGGAFAVRGGLARTMAQGVSHV